MKLIFLRFLIPFLVFFLNFFPTLAQTTLQKAEIEQYIDALPQIYALSQTTQPNDQEQGIQTPISLKTDEFSRTPISDSLVLLKEQPTYEKFNTIVMKAGFLSTEGWASAGDKIMIAYSAYHLKHPINKASPTIDVIKSDMQEQLKLIEANQFISGEQKQTLLNKIQNSMALLNDPNYIDSENISIISPYIERLNSLFEEYQ